MWNDFSLIQLGTTKNRKGMALATILILSLTMLQGGCAGLAGSQQQPGGGPEPQSLTVSNASAGNVTATSAAVSWQTNLPATSQIEFGTSTSYGSTTAIDASLVVSHQQAMSGLTAATQYHFRVRSRDANNNEALSNDMTVTTSASPDTTVPTVSITSPAANATVSGTISVGATASDNVGVAGVQFKVDNANTGAEDTSAPYSYSLDTRTLSNGNHSLTAVARDSAGNRTTSTAVSVTVNNTSSDTTPPSVSLSAPSAGATISGTVTISASASDNVGVVGVQFRVDGSNVGNEDTSSPYSFSWNTTGVSNGSHSLTAVARDAAGNRTTSAAVSVTVSNAAPPPPPPSGGMDFPDGWTHYATPTFESACPSNPPSDIEQIQGCRSIIDTWNGAAWDSTRKRMIIWGGGHNSYCGNEIYVADPYNKTFTRLNNYSNPVNMNTEANPDGAPVSRHTYSGLTYIQSTDEFFSVGGSLCNNGNASRSSWTFNVGTLKWTQRNTNNNLYLNYNYNAIYRSTQNDVILWDGGMGVYSYNISAKSYTQIGDGVGDGLDVTCDIDQARQLMFCIGSGRATQYNLSANPVSHSDIGSQVSGCGPVMSSRNPGWSYDPWMGKIVGWNGGNTVYAFDPTTKACTPYTFTNGPGSPASTGTYGRWRNIAPRTFMLVNNYGDGMWIFRIPDERSFSQRCASPGVYDCQGFENDSFLTPATYPNTGLYPGSCFSCDARDTSVRASGVSSYRMQIPSNSDSRPTGEWRQRFDKDYAENSTFYFSFRFRADSNWVNVDWTNTGPGTFPKLFIASHYSASCALLELTMINRNAWETPTGYSDCGQRHFSTDPDGITVNPTNDTPYLLQQGFTQPEGGYKCFWGDPDPTGDCFFIPANEWITFYLKVHIGNWDQPNSTVEAWVARAGAPMKNLWHVIGWTFHQDTPAFNNLALTQYMTGKRTSVAHAMAQVWYDDLIMSTQPIPAPNGTTP